MGSRKEIFLCLSSLEARIKANELAFSEFMVNRLPISKSVRSALRIELLSANPRQIQALLSDKAFDFVTKLLICNVFIFINDLLVRIFSH